jgi:hypothetical protein
MTAAEERRYQYYFDKGVDARLLATAADAFLDFDLSSNDATLRFGSKS